MDLYIERDALIRGLARVQGIVERRTTNPALSHVLLTARGDRLRMTATDTQITLVADYGANVTVENELCVEAQHFFQIARTLPDPTVQLKLAGTRLTLTSGAAVFNMNVLSADEFPPLPSREDKGTVRLTGGDLRRLIEETLFSISGDDNRYGLNGAHLEEIKGEDGGKTIRVVTTDGSRLSWSEAPFEGSLALGRRMLLPRKALAEVRKLCEDPETVWDLSLGDRSVTFTSPGLTLSVRLVDGEFPDYRQVLPAAYRRRAVVARDRFEGALRRVALVATDRNHSVRFRFAEDALELTAENVDLGDAREELPVEFEGGEMSTGFNIKYFQDLLSATQGERLVLEMGDVLDPCIVRIDGREDCRFIIMPMRLD